MTLGAAFGKRDGEFSVTVLRLAVTEVNVARLRHPAFFAHGHLVDEQEEERAENCANDTGETESAHSGRCE